MDRKLINYLPPVLRDVVDFQAINEACEPEISLARDALALVMANQFLETATELGVSVWERELGIRPKDTDSLDARKTTIKSMWNLELPYTITWLRQWLAAVAAGSPYEAAIRDGYTLDILTEWDRAGQVDSLKSILERTVPSNIRINSVNTITCGVDSPHNAASAVVLCDCIFLSDTGNQVITVGVPSIMVSGIVPCERVELSDTEKATVSTEASMVNAAGVITAEQINITD